MTYAKDIAILFALFLVEMISAKVISEGRNFLLRLFFTLLFIVAIVRWHVESIELFYRFEEVITEDIFNSLSCLTVIQAFLAYILEKFFRNIRDR